MANLLKLGMHGDGVKTLQTLLVAKGAKINIDGSFGPATELAVKDYQKAHNLLVDGIVGGNTWSQLVEGTNTEDVRVVSPYACEQMMVGDRYVDSYPYSQGGTEVQARRLRSCRRPIDGVFGYLGVINKQRVDQVVYSGMGFAPVTLANRFDGIAAVQQANAIGMPQGVTIGLDIEGRKILNGVDWTTLTGAALEAHVQDIANKIFLWNNAVKAAGFRTGLYVGSPQPFTTWQLGDFGFDTYWNALSREADRFGALAEPLRGWQIWQMFPQHTWEDTGVFVDVNMIGQDFHERLPYCAVAK